MMMMIIIFPFSPEYNRDFDHAKSVRMRQCLEEIINNNTDLLCFSLPQSFNRSLNSTNEQNNPIKKKFTVLVRICID